MSTARQQQISGISGRSQAIVIGGGFGGMAAALRLRAKGYQVHLLDRCSRLGGRAQVFERDGFRHDAGPTVITAPFLFEELFQLFGRQMSDYLQLVPLTPWYRFRFADGEHFDYGGTVEETQAEIARLSPADSQGYLELVEASRRIFEVGFDGLADQPFHRFSTMLRQLPHLMRLKSHRSVWQLVTRHIQDERLRQAFSIQPLLVGGNPFDTTCIYSLIHYLERRWGVHFAMGGTGAIVDALARLMTEQGIRISLGCTVEHIETQNGVARAVQLDNGQRLTADVIVSNTDPAYLYQNLLPAQAQSVTARFKRRFSRYSMGLFVLFFGSRQHYPDVAHHTIWLGRRYRELLDDIFHRQILADDFSLYLHRPTATDPTFAPAGCDSFYVLAPVPNLQAGIDWQQQGPRLRDRIVASLDATILPGLRQHITADFFMTPEDFQQDYLSVAGAGFSIAPLFTQSAWFRFHNQAEGPRNLYLVGAGTHPGAGVPGVLCSARVLDRLVPACGVVQSARS